MPNQTKSEADLGKIRNHLQLLIQNLGGFQKINGKTIFFTRKETADTLKRLSYQLFKSSEVENPFMRYFLLEWRFVKENLMPIITTQGENKEIMFQSFRLLWILTEPYEESDLTNFQFAKDFLELRESLRSFLASNTFMTCLVREIEDCAAAGDQMLDVQKKMLAFCFGTVKNLLSLNIKPLLPQIMPILNKDSGLLDALIFFAENVKTAAFHQYYLDLAKIVVKLLGGASAKAVWGPKLENDPEFKRRMELQKLAKIKR